MEIRIVVTANGEADQARTVLDDLRRRLGELPDTAAVIREKPPGFSYPFGDTEVLLDVVLGSDDTVPTVAQAVENWLRRQVRDVVLTVTVLTASVDLHYPSRTGAAAVILVAMQEGREKLRSLREKAHDASERAEIRVDHSMITSDPLEVLEEEIFGDVSLAQPPVIAYGGEPIRRQGTGESDVPVTIYLGDGHTHGQVETAVEDALAGAGMYVAERQDPVSGSWSRNLRARMRSGAKTPAGREAMAVALHALEQRAVLEKDADIAQKLMTGVQGVITALQPERNAVVRMGPVLIVKADGHLTVLQLTVEQQLMLNHRPQLHRAPRDLLDALGHGPDSAAALEDGQDPRPEGSA